MNRNLTIVIAVVLLVGGGLLLPVFTEPTNCGGNSAALNQVRQIALVACVGAMDTKDHTFLYSEANADERRQLLSLSTNHWVQGARFLVTTTPIMEHEEHPHRVIVICDKPYSNVSRQRFGTAPPTHAVGFVDGTSGLISTAEYAALDRASFIPLSELYLLKVDRE